MKSLFAPPLRFQFMGIAGYLYFDNFVCWGGMAFQIEAALPALRAAIERAGRSTQS